MTWFGYWSTNWTSTEWDWWQCWMMIWWWISGDQWSLGQILWPGQGQNGWWQDQISGGANRIWSRTTKQWQEKFSSLEGTGGIFARGLCWRSVAANSSGHSVSVVTLVRVRNFNQFSFSKSFGHWMTNRLSANHTPSQRRLVVWSQATNRSSAKHTPSWWRFCPKVRSTKHVIEHQLNVGKQKLRASYWLFQVLNTILRTFTLMGRTLY